MWESQIRVKSAFTLLELIVVIIIIGVLGSLGFTQYTKMVEKGRTVEAKSILGSIRGAEEAYKLENGVYTDQLLDLIVGTQELIDCAPNGKYYYKYSVAKVGTDDFLATATRCSPVDKGKKPGYVNAYTITIGLSGEFKGEPN